MTDSSLANSIQTKQNAYIRQVNHLRLPSMKYTDTLELYHLRSFPQLLIDMGETGKFLTQTSGLAIRNIVTNQVIVLEYHPMNYSACFMPIIHFDANNFSSIIWDKRAIVSYSPDINKQYWQQSTFLALINGVVYENYVQWIYYFLSKHPLFVPFAICSNEDDVSCFTSDLTWDTFVYESLLVFSSYAVEINAIIPPR